MSHFAQSTIIIAFFFGIDKIMGLVRQILVAREFGLTFTIDAFNAANNIPDLLSALISGGALGVALIPVLSEYLEKSGRPALWDLFSRILNLAFLATAGISILIVLFAEPLVQYLIAPGFEPPQQELTVSLMRLDLFAIIIFSISGLVMAGLQANQHFIFPAMAPVFYNLGQIFGVAILAPEQGIQIGPITLPAFGMGVYGLVYGVIIGALLHLAIQIPGLIIYKFRWTPKINLRNPGVQQVLRLLGPRLVTMLFIQWFFIVRDNLASGLAEGSVTSLNYGWFIMQVPETLFGTAIAIVLLPTLSAFFARGDRDGFRDTVNLSIRVMLALTLPAAVLLAVVVRSLVGVLGFDADGSDMVAWATRFYLLGLVGHALLEIGARSFYGQQDARTPLYAAALNALIYTVLAISLSRLFGFLGIALANSLAFTLEAFILLWLLNRRLPGVLRLGRTLLRVLAAALLSGLVALGVVTALGGWAESGITLIISGLLAAGVGVLVALPLIWPEIRALLQFREPLPERGE